MMIEPWRRSATTTRCLWARSSARRPHINAHASPRQNQTSCFSRSCVQENRWTWIALQTSNYSNFVPSWCLQIEELRCTSQTQLGKVLHGEMQLIIYHYIYHQRKSIRYGVFSPQFGKSENNINQISATLNALKISPHRWVFRSGLQIPQTFAPEHWKM